MVKVPAGLAVAEGCLLLPRWRLVVTSSGERDTGPPCGRWRGKEAEGRVNSIDEGLNHS